MAAVQLYRPLSSTLILLLTLTLAVLMSLPLTAQESQKTSTIEVEVSEIDLSQIPYVSKLFKNFGVSNGIVVDCGGVPVVDSTAVCQQPCCQQLVACEVTCETQQQVACNGKQVICNQGLEVSKYELMSSLSEALAHAAALEAALETREQFESQKEDLLQSLAQALMRNAKLEAHAESLERQLATQSEVAQTKIENAKLQAKLEFALEREQLVKTHAQVLADNQRLKSQLVKLEKVYTGALAKKARAAAAAEYAGKKKLEVKR